MQIYRQFGPNCLERQISKQFGPKPYVNFLPSLFFPLLFSFLSSFVLILFLSFLKHAKGKRTEREIEKVKDRDWVRERDTQRELRRETEMKRRGKTRRTRRTHETRSSMDHRPEPISGDPILVFDRWAANHSFDDFSRKISRNFR